MTLKPGAMVRVMRGFSRGDEGAICEVIDQDKARMEVTFFGSKREMEVDIADLDHPDIDPRRWMRRLLQDQLSDRRNDEYLHWWSSLCENSTKEQPLEDYRAFIAWRDQNAAQLDQQCQPVFDQFDEACSTPSYEAEQYDNLIAKWEEHKQAWMDAIRPAPLNEDEAEIAAAKKYRDEAFDAYVDGADDEEARRLRWCLVGMPTPHDAVLSQSLNKLRAAIGVGQDLNEFDEDGHTPLSIAASQGLTEIIGVLIESGADVNAKKEDSWPPLYCAARFGQLEATQALIAAGANLDIPG